MASKCRKNAVVGFFPHGFRENPLPVSILFAYFASEIIKQPLINNKKTIRL
jgi:hypothetical protein